MRGFPYGAREMDALAKADERLGAAIARIGPLEREISTDPFEALISSIVSQQISSKAADTVFARLGALLGGITPDAVAGADVGDIQKCGLSMRKAGYIKDIGEAAADGAIDFDALHTLGDAEIVRRLTALNGVGVWTVEMLLIFSFCRMDVVSWGDFGIRKGMMRLYGLSELDRKTFDSYRSRYSPYGTVASLYLWQIASTPNWTP